MTCPRARGFLCWRGTVLALESEGAGLDFHARSSTGNGSGSTPPALTAGQTLAERCTHRKVDVRFSPNFTLRPRMAADRSAISVVEILPGPASPDRRRI